MKWYLAKIVFQIICGDGKHTPQFDEQLRLVKATNEDEAYQRATELGVKEQEVFFNDKQQMVQWKFIDVPELYQLSLTEGAELGSKISEVDHAGRYIEYVHTKAAQIKDKWSHRMLQLF